MPGKPAIPFPTGIKTFKLLQRVSHNIPNRIYHRSLTQREKSQPEDKQIMLETRFTKFPALSVDPRAEMSQSGSETEDGLFFLPMTLKIIIHHSSFLLFLTAYVA